MPEEGVQRFLVMIRRKPRSFLFSQYDGAYGVLQHNTFRRGLLYVAIESPAKTQDCGFAWAMQALRLNDCETTRFYRRFVLDSKAAFSCNIMGETSESKILGIKDALKKMQLLVNVSTLKSSPFDPTFRLQHSGAVDKRANFSGK